MNSKIGSYWWFSVYVMFWLLCEWKCGKSFDLFLGFCYYDYEIGWLWEILFWKKVDSLVWDGLWFIVLVVLVECC